MSMASRTMSFCPSILPWSTENFSRLLQRALNDLRAAGFSEGDIQAMRSVDMRYRYQVHELNVPFPPGTRTITESDMETLSARFDDLYEKAFGQGSGYREAGKEILTFRLTAAGLLKKPDVKAEPVSTVERRRSAQGPARCLLRGKQKVRANASL